MREYLFRGIDVKTGKWHYGYFIPHMNDGIRRRSIKVYSEEEGAWATEFEVIPETVGQYVGINDDNTVKIFEKDIVKVSYRIRDEGGNYIKKQENRLVSLEHSSFGLMSIFGEWPMGYMCEPITVEVIGNIIDNPDLLGGKND